MKDEHTWLDALQHQPSPVYDLHGVPLEPMLAWVDGLLCSLLLTLCTFNTSLVQQNNVCCVIHGRPFVLVAVDQKLTLPIVLNKIVVSRKAPAMKIPLTKEPACMPHKLWLANRNTAALHKSLNYQAGRHVLHRSMLSASATLRM